MTTVESLGRREQKRFVLRRTVRDTAWRLVAEHGYDTVTVDQIATGAGISVATFYRHFTSKEGVLTRRWLSPERLAQLEPELDRDHGLARVVASLFEAYVGAVAGYQVDLMTRLKVIHLDPGLQLAMARGRSEDAQTLAALFAEVTGQPPESLAMRLAASLTSSARIAAMSRWAELDGRPALGILLREVAETLAPSLDRCETAISTSAHTSVGGRTT
ncbi:TetR/AcrR family transcriptional regulator [Nocardia jinanensis]|uniref:TetR family transcriptional regulator n=1 Tax=Nocardia jinanensis TaxID=382504 RepID=A0A917VUA8_9NOCA|nr:TetR/AcrR family transcriptional regulator [Nocardia jinanensis]GGL14786.1 TetR family transcriptional regulator [Nocardia jinanensis]